MPSPPPHPSMTPQRSLLVAKGWVQGAILVLLIGLFALGLLAYRTYAAQAPIPARVVTATGEVLFTAADVTAGQELFLRYGLMEYGSIFGHGAYLGPDFTAESLRRAALATKKYYHEHGDADAAGHTVEDYKTNRYDAATDILLFTPAQAVGFIETQAHYASYFAQPPQDTGLHLQSLLQPADIHALSSFFAWTAWVASASRPDKDYSFTNNWPPEALVNNRPTAAALVASMLSLAALLVGTGILLALFGRRHLSGAHHRPRRATRTTCFGLWLAGRVDGGDLWQPRW